MDGDNSGSASQTGSNRPQGTSSTNYGTTNQIGGGRRGSNQVDRYRGGRTTRDSTRGVTTTVDTSRTRGTTNRVARGRTRAGIPMIGRNPTGPNLNTVKGRTQLGSQQVGVITTRRGTFPLLIPRDALQGRGINQPIAPQNLGINQPIIPLGRGINQPVAPRGPGIFVAQN